MKSSPCSVRAGWGRCIARWLAYQSNESGRAEIDVVPFPGAGEKIQVSTSGGQMPRWRRDARELFFMNLNGSTLMVADLKSNGSSLDVGVDKPLFAIRPDMGNWPYDVTADGGSSS